MTPLVCLRPQQCHARASGHPVSTVLRMETSLSPSRVLWLLDRPVKPGDDRTVNVEH